ncbi:hypothetical protein C7M84_011237 [Penaeus vannamei]|uniref:Uncharacterized protein n=1 Tax=Penaeus vannamei TaxID=6689 RepID=A0A423T1X1_PENVA|nr:hypothetical protein C7M84_011237 [Penaeus vannamei]
MSSLPMEPIVKFTGYNYPPEQLFLETENFIASLDPHIQRGSYEFDKRCLQHVTQRLDLTNPAVSAMLSGLTKDADRGWHTFKEQLSQRFMPPRGKASVELARIFKMRPASFSQGDITEFYVKVKQAIDDFLELLRRDEHMMIAHEHLEIILPQIRMLLAEGIVFDCLPAKLCTNAQIMYTRPESPGLLPTHLAKACGFVTNSDTAGVVAHTGNVSFSLHPPHGVTCRLHPVRHAGSPVPLTGVTAGRSTGDLHGPPAGPLHGPLWPPHTLPRTLPPAPPLASATTRVTHQIMDTIQERVLSLPSRGPQDQGLPHSPSPEVRPARTGVYVTSPRQPDDTSPCGAPLLPIRVGSHELLAFLDSGSAVSIIPVSSLSKCNTPSACTPTPYIVHGASGSCLDVVGEVSLTIHLSDVPIPHPFVVINGPAVPGDILLGYDFMAKTGLHQIPRENVAVHFGRVYALTPPGGVWRRSHGHSITEKAVTPSAPASDKVTTGPPDTSATTATLSGYTQPKVTPTPGYRNFTPLAATSARTWTPASDSPFCQTSETTVLPPFTDCVVPVTIPDTSGTVLVLPEGIRVHGLLALPAVYDAPDGQFSLRLINTLDSPIRLEHSTRVLDCEVTPLPIRMMDTAAPTFHTSTSPVTVPRSPDASAPSTAHVPDVTAVDFAEGPAILGGLFKEFPLILPSTERPIGRTNILEHSIHLQQDAKPVYIPAYRVPHSRRGFRGSD